MEHIPSFQQKGELNLQLSIALQLHAARPAGSLPFCIAYPPMHEIPELTESDQACSVSVKEFNTYRTQRTEAKTKRKINIEEL